MSTATLWIITPLGLAVGLLSAMFVTVPDWAAWLMVLPGRLARKVDRDSTELPSCESIETVATDGARLVGSLMKNPGASGRTALILHGLGEERSAMLSRASLLRRHGWSVVATDSRAFGESGGDRVSFGAREATDLRSWIDRLEQTLGPIACLAVWGRSMGASVALRASIDDSRIHLLILEAPFADLSVTLARKLERFRLPFANLLARLALARARRLAGLPLHQPRPIDLAGRVRARTLCLHGRLDTLVPIAEARKLVAAFSNPPTLIEIDDAGHRDVVERGGDAVARSIVEFLEAGRDDR